MSFGHAEGGPPLALVALVLVAVFIGILFGWWLFGSMT
jgi:hypothetical protein